MDERIRRAFLRGANGLDEAVDSVRSSLQRRLGIDQPKYVDAYRGIHDGSKMTVSGRVLANRPAGGPREDDDWQENLANTYRRWNSRELPGVRVELRHGPQVQTVETDDEGYYQASFEASGRGPGELSWVPVTATVRDDEGETFQAVHEVLVPGSDMKRLIISDMDDTVLHTGITNLALAAKLTFLDNARTRKPLLGVAELYRALQRHGSDRPVHPIFYVSSSAWNLHDLLRDFLELNRIPKGPLLLRDLGVDRTRFIKEKGHGHKLEKIDGVLRRFPGVPAVLIGDSGQEDAEIYAEVVERFPSRVEAIYIRDVDPDQESQRDEKVLESLARVGDAGVPFELGRDSVSFAHHAIELGILEPAALDEIAVEVNADRKRPTAAEAAVVDPS